MNYCSHCGARVELRVPEGDTVSRHVCTSCGTIHYENPKMVVGCIPEWEDRILLCRRAIEPRRCPGEVNLTCPDQPDRLVTLEQVEQMT